MKVQNFLKNWNLAIFFSVFQWRLIKILNDATASPIYDILYKETGTMSHRERIGYGPTS